MKAPTDAWWRLPPALSGTAACFSKTSYNICRSFGFIAMGLPHGNRCEEALPSELSLNQQHVAPGCWGRPCGPISSARIRLTNSLVCCCSSCPWSTPTHCLVPGMLLPQRLPRGEHPHSCFSALHVCPGASKASRGSPEVCRSGCCPSSGPL